MSSNFHPIKSCGMAHESSAPTVENDATQQDQQETCRMQISNTVGLAAPPPAQYSTVGSALKFLFSRVDPEIKIRQDRDFSFLNSTQAPSAPGAV